MRLQLALIGNAIAKSRAPTLHKFLGNLHGFDVDYELFDPSLLGRNNFEDQFLDLLNNGFDGCNITYPFKQIALEFIKSPDSFCTLTGAANTVRFGEITSSTNTDYSGFIRAIRSKLRADEVGSTLILGAGGVGSAVAFGLTSLSIESCYVFDRLPDRAIRLVKALRSNGHLAEAVSLIELERVSQKVEGLLNCSPVGHYQSLGMPIQEKHIGNQKWAFDAVYTPVETEFLRTCREANLNVISGFELFFYQGLDSFEFWTEQKTDEKQVKAAFIRESGIDLPSI